MKKSLMLLFVVLSFAIFINGFAFTAHAESESRSFDYTIQSGDTLYSLALRFNSSVGEIQSLNRSLAPRNLTIGRIIKINAGPGIIIHYVKSGETLWKIAINYGCTVSSIVRKNHISNPDRIYIGDLLAVPFHHSDRKKEVIWLNGWLPNNAYDKVYLLYKETSEEKLDMMIDELKVKLSRENTLDVEGKNIPMRKINYGINENGLGGITILKWGFSQRMGVGYGYHPELVASFNKDRIGQSNSVPVDPVKMSKALFVLVLQEKL